MFCCSLFGLGEHSRCWYGVGLSIGLLVNGHCGQALQVDLRGPSYSVRIVVHTGKSSVGRASGSSPVSHDSCGRPPLPPPLPPRPPPLAPPLDMTTQGMQVDNRCAKLSNCSRNVVAPRCAPNQDRCWVIGAEDVQRRKSKVDRDQKLRVTKMWRGESAVHAAVGASIPHFVALDAILPCRSLTQAIKQFQVVWAGIHWPEKNFCRNLQIIRIVVILLTF